MTQNCEMCRVRNSGCNSGSFFFVRSSRFSCCYKSRTRFRVREWSRATRNVDLSDATPEVVLDWFRRACEVLVQTEFSPTPICVRVRLLLRMLQANSCLMSSASTVLWREPRRSSALLRRSISKFVLMLNGLQVRALVGAALMHPFVDPQLLSNRLWSSCRFCG